MGTCVLISEIYADELVWVGTHKACDGCHYDPGSDVRGREESLEIINQETFNTRETQKKCNRFHD